VGEENFKEMNINNMSFQMMLCDHKCDHNLHTSLISIMAKQAMSFKAQQILFCQFCCLKAQQMVSIQQLIISILAPFVWFIAPAATRRPEIMLPFGSAFTLPIVKAFTTRARRERKLLCLYLKLDKIWIDNQVFRTFM
jgi:hypothetical protein